MPQTQTSMCEHVMHSNKEVKNVRWCHPMCIVGLQGRVDQPSNLVPALYEAILPPAHGEKDR